MRPGARRPDDRPIDSKAVARGAGGALLSRMGSVIEIVAQPAYVLLFGLPTYGLYTVLWSAVNVAENVFDLGMTSALQRVVPQAADEAEAAASLRWALLLGVGPCLAVAAAASLLAPEVATLINVAPADRPRLVEAVALFAWALPLWAFIEIGTSGLRARRAFGPEIRLRILWEQLIRLPVAICLWLIGARTLGLMVAHLVSLTITAGLCLRLLARYYDLRLVFTGRAVAGSGSATLLAGLSVLPGNIAARMFSDAPPVVLNMWFPGAAGAASAGLYGIARKLSSLIQMIRLALSYVMGPLASAVARDDRGAIEPLYGYATRLATALSLPVATGLVAGSGAILLLFGPAAAGAIVLIWPLAIARVVDAITGPGNAIQQVASARRRAATGNLSGLAVSVCLAFVLLDRLGAQGMALAVAAGLITTSLVVAAQLYVHEGLSPFRAPFPRTIAVALLVSGAEAALLALVPRALEGLGVIPVVALLLAALWISLRYALDAEDRASFGKTGRTLGLAPPR